MSKTCVRWIGLAVMAFAGMVLTGCEAPGGGGDDDSPAAKQTTIHLKFQATNLINGWSNGADADFTFTGESGAGAIDGYSRGGNNQNNAVTWDVKVVYYRSISDHKIVINQRNSTLTLDVKNNNFTVSGWGTAVATGYVTQK